MPRPAKSQQPLPPVPEVSSDPLSAIAATVVQGTRDLLDLPDMGNPAAPASETNATGVRKLQSDAAEMLLDRLHTSSRHDRHRCYIERFTRVSEILCVQASLPDRMEIATAMQQPGYSNLLNLVQRELEGSTHQMLMVLLQPVT